MIKVDLDDARDDYDACWMIKVDKRLKFDEETMIRMMKIEVVEVTVWGLDLSINVWTLSIDASP